MSNFTSNEPAVRTIRSNYEPTAETSSSSSKLGHLFEFMDLNWLPNSLAYTMREILECGNARPFRPFYDFSIATIRRVANELGCEHVVEMGAGAAPLTRRLAPLVENEPDQSIKTISPCDIRPDTKSYLELEAKHPGVVDLLRDEDKEIASVDFSVPQDWKPNSLLVLSGTLHHLPNLERTKTLTAMSSADSVLVIEPLRKTALSMLFVILSLVPALLLPIWYCRRAGRARRFLWCWLIPVAPAMFLWDGWVSCIRQWTDKEFKKYLSQIPGIEYEVNHGVFSQVTTIRKTSNQAEH